MCIIAITKDRMLTQEEFENCWNHNPDGFGMAWHSLYKNGKQAINYVKGKMEHDEAWKLYQGIKNTQMILHFRIKTAGDVCSELTHPFLISPTSPNCLEYRGDIPILFHNGSQYSWQDDCLDYVLKSEKRVTGNMSDSRWIAMDIGSRTDKHEIIIEMLQQKQGKFVLMETKKITYIGDFTEEDGVFFSNTTYKTARSYKTKKSYYGNYYDYDDGSDEWWERYKNPRNKLHGV
jgi:predicted glutamine amidotransferase